MLLEKMSAGACEVGQCVGMATGEGLRNKCGVGEDADEIGTV